MADSTSKAIQCQQIANELSSNKSTLLKQLYKLQESEYRKARSDKAYEDPQSPYYKKIKTDLHIEWSEIQQNGIIEDYNTMGTNKKTLDPVNGVVSFRAMYDTMADIPSGYTVEEDDDGKKNIRAVGDGEDSLTWGELDRIAAGNVEISEVVTSDTVKGLKEYDPEAYEDIGIQYACGEISEEDRKKIDLLAEHGDKDEKKSAKDLQSSMSHGAYQHVGNWNSANAKSSEELNQLVDAVNEGVATHVNEADPNFADVSADAMEISSSETSQTNDMKEDFDELLGSNPLTKFLSELIKKLQKYGIDFVNFGVDSINGLIGLDSNQNTIGSKLTAMKNDENLSDAQKELYTNVYHKMVTAVVDGQRGDPLLNQVYDGNLSEVDSARFQKYVSDSLKEMSAKDTMSLLSEAKSIDIWSYDHGTNGLNPIANEAFNALTSSESVSVNGGISQKTFGFADSDNVISYSDADISIMKDLVNSSGSYAAALSEYSSKGTSVHEYLKEWTEGLTFSENSMENDAAQRMMLKNLEQSVADHLSIDESKLDSVKYGDLSLEDWLSTYYLADDALQKTVDSKEYKDLIGKDTGIDIDKVKDQLSSILPKTNVLERVEEQAISEKNVDVNNLTDHIGDFSNGLDPILNAVTDRMSTVYGEKSDMINSVKEMGPSITVEGVVEALADSDEQVVSILSHLQENGIDKDATLGSLIQDKVTMLSNMVLGDSSSEQTKDTTQQSNDTKDHKTAAKEDAKSADKSSQDSGLTVHTTEKQKKTTEGKGGSKTTDKQIESKLGQSLSDINKNRSVDSSVTSLSQQDISGALGDISKGVSVVKNLGKQVEANTSKDTQSKELF